VPPSLAQSLMVPVPEFFQTEKQPEVMSVEVGSEAAV